MPPNVINGLFKKFYRSHRSRASIIGTGIGLYISKAIVQSHGGDITVSSAEGEGSTFTVSLPTYASQSKNLAKDNSNATIIEERPSNFIKNHGLVKG
jgi:signal transduction histidine kinase